MVQWRLAEQRHHKPVAILLTYSGDWHRSSSNRVLRRIMRQEQTLPEGERLTVHVIGFGQSVDAEFIKQLADIGNGSHMTCHAAQDIDRRRLVHAFKRIAAHPALKVCLQD
jgi:hypothetical protein